MLGLPWPRLNPPSPVSIIWNYTTGICQTHVACCHTGTLVYWDWPQIDWPCSVFLDPVSIPGWIPHGYLKYANFWWPSKIEFGPKVERFLKPGLNIRDIIQHQLYCAMAHNWELSDFFSAGVLIKKKSAPLSNYAILIPMSSIVPRTGFATTPGA